MEWALLSLAILDEVIPQLEEAGWDSWEGTTSFSMSRQITDCNL